MHAYAVRRAGTSVRADLPQICTARSAGAGTFHTHMHPFACRPAYIKKCTHIRLRHTQDRHQGHRLAAGNKNPHRNATGRSPLQKKATTMGHYPQPIGSAAAVCHRHSIFSQYQSPQAQHHPQLCQADLMHAYDRHTSAPKALRLWPCSSAPRRSISLCSCEQGAGISGASVARAAGVYPRTEE